MEMPEGKEETLGRAKRCQEWLPRKNRFCASVALPDQEYCGNHRISTVDIRVPCLIDPSHTVLQSELQIHAKKCPALKQMQWSCRQPYFYEGMNAGSDDDGDSSAAIGHDKNQQNDANLLRTEEKYMSKLNHVSSKTKRTAVASMCKTEFEDLLKRIDFVYQNYCSEPEESILQPKACSNWLESSDKKGLPFQEKHAVQQASLLGNLKSFGLLNPHTSNSTQSELSDSQQNGIHAVSDSDMNRLVYVEFGAGRGYLSQMLCDCFGVSNVLLVERRSYKFKADRTLRQSSGVTFSRLRIDIENLNLEGVGMLQNSQFISISKHLCGAATDLALRCCLVTSKSSKQNSHKRMEASPLLYGIGIATCCHHLCQWKSYVNKNFFVSLGFSVDEFHIITWLTSWALSGDEEHSNDHEFSGVDWANQEESNLIKNDGFGIPGERLHEVKHLTEKKDRKLLGMKCKQILDCGRLLWLKQHGLEVKYVQYVPEGVSPENKVLLARWQDKK